MKIKFIVIFTMNFSFIVNLTTNLTFVVNLSQILGRKSQNHIYNSHRHFFAHSARRKTISLTMQRGRRIDVRFLPPSLSLKIRWESLWIWADLTIQPPDLCFAAPRSRIYWDHTLPWSIPVGCLHNYDLYLFESYFSKVKASHEPFMLGSCLRMTSAYFLGIKLP